MQKDYADRDDIGQSWTRRTLTGIKTMAAEDGTPRYLMSAAAAPIATCRSN